MKKQMKSHSKLKDGAISYLSLLPIFSEPNYRQIINTMESCSSFFISI